MFFPLKDDNPTYRTPVLTIALIAINALVFLYELTTGLEQVIMQFGLIPADLLGSSQTNPYSGGPDPGITLFTSMFLHGGWMHLIGNMMFLWIFGNNIEDVLGPVKFLIFYLLCGLGAAGLQILFNASSTVPMVGASGAISGVLGAYLILYPRVRIFTLVFLGIFITTARIQAIWFLGIWIAYQAFFALAGLASPGEGGGTAWFAHVGGFAFGVLLIFLMKPGRRADFQWPWARAQRLRKFEAPPREDDDNVHRGPWG